MNNNTEFKKLIKDNFYSLPGSEQFTFLKQAREFPYLVLINGRDIEFTEGDLSDFILISFTKSLDYTSENFEVMAQENQRVAVTFKGDNFHTSLSSWDNLVFVETEFVLGLDYNPFTDQDVLAAECELSSAPIGYRDMYLDFHHRLFPIVRDGYGVFLDKGWKSEDHKKSFNFRYQLKCLKDAESEYERSVYVVLEDENILAYIVDLPEMRDTPALHIQDIYSWNNFIQNLIANSNADYLYKLDKILDVNEIL